MLTTAGIPFQIASYTSEDPNRPVANLTLPPEQNPGWQSVPYGQYPQEIIVQLGTGVYKLNAVHILSHEYKISQTVELSVGTTPDGSPPVSPFSCRFVSLGKTHFDTNIANRFQCNELKSFSMDTYAQLVKLTFSEPHSNEYNPTRQVGIRSIKIEGTPILQQSQNQYLLNQQGPVNTPHFSSKIMERPSNLPPPTAPFTFTNQNGFTPGSNSVLNQPNQNAISPSTAGFSQTPSTFMPGSAAPSTIFGQNQFSQGTSSHTQIQTAGMDQLAKQGFDEVTARQIMEINLLKEEAVSNEDYEEAKRLREIIQRLSERGALLADLVRQKREAIINENYTEADRLKKEEDDVRKECLLMGKQSVQKSAGFFHDSSSDQPQSIFNEQSKSSSAQARGKRRTIFAQQMDDQNEALPPSEKEPEKPPTSKFSAFRAELNEVSDTANDPPTRLNQPNSKPNSQPAGNDEIKVGGNSAYNWEAEWEAEKKKSGVGDGTDNSERGSAPTTRKPFLKRKAVGVKPPQPKPKMADVVDKAVRMNEGSGLTDAQMDAYDQSVAVLGEKCVADVLSSEYLRREQGFNEATRQVNELASKSDTGGGRAIVLVPPEVEKMVKGVLLLLEDHIRTEKNGKVYTALMKTVVALYKLSLPFRQLYPIVIQSCFGPIFQRMGDPISAVAQASSVCTKEIVEATNTPAILSTVAACLFSDFMFAERKVQTDNKIVNSIKPDQTPKQICARIVGMKAVGEKLGEMERVGKGTEKERAGVLTRLMKTAFASQEHADDSVRMRGKELFIQLYTTHPEPVTSFMQTLFIRPAIKQQLDKAMETAAHNRHISLALAEQSRLAEPSPTHKVSTMQRDDALVRMRNERKKNQKDGFEGLNSSSFCEFCGEQNDSWDQTGLRRHQAYECPMLIECPACQGVVRVEFLNEHKLDECRQKSMFVECPRCHEAVLQGHVQAHLSSGQCNIRIAESEYARCPLCHQDILDGEASWIQHLALPPGCPMNNRTKGKWGR